MKDAEPYEHATVVAEPAAVRLFVWTVFPLLGALLGWLVDSVADWVATRVWAPFQGPFKLLASVSEPQAMIGSVTVGAAAGLALAGVAAWERLTVTVSGERVGLRSRGATREIDRAAVGAVFLDGKRLVLLGPASDELASEPAGDLPAGPLRDAFVGRGYPWRDGDPYAGEFRRWVDGDPELPAGINALLRARARALDVGDADDAKELRSELAGLGVVVRDEKKRQHWRRTGRLPH